jgi:hypothetical protein
VKVKDRSFQVNLPDQSPCKSITLRVSIASIDFSSRFKSDFCALKGMVSGSPALLLGEAARLNIAELVLGWKMGK